MNWCVKSALSRTHCQSENQLHICFLACCLPAHGEKGGGGTDGGRGLPVGTSGSNALWVCPPPPFPPWGCDSVSAPCSPCFVCVLVAHQWRLWSTIQLRMPHNRRIPPPKTNSQNIRGYPLKKKKGRGTTLAGHL